MVGIALLGFYTFDRGTSLELLVDSSGLQMRQHLLTYVSHCKEKTDRFRKNIDMCNQNLQIALLELLGYDLINYSPLMVFQMREMYGGSAVVSGDRGLLKFVLSQNSRTSRKRIMRETRKSPIYSLVGGILPRKEHLIYSSSIGVGFFEQSVNGKYVPV